MSIKLIAVDLDGTLLNSKKELPQGNIDAIRWAVSQGVEVAFATGRIGSELDDLVCALPEVRYSLQSNGAIVVDMKKNTLIHSQMMSMKEACGIYDMLKDFTMMFELFGRDILAVDEICLRDLDAYGVGYIADLIHHSRVGIPHFDYYIHHRQEPVGKVNIFFPTTEMRDQALERVKHLPYEITYQEPTNLEFNVRHANKGTGLEQLANYLHLKQSEVMAIGDNNNDLAMLAYAGCAVAMANAKEEAKQLADVIAPSNDDCGVAQVIYQMVGRD